jgi:hypothetical protein
MESRLNRRALLRVVVVTGAAIPIAVGSSGRVDAATGTTVLAGRVESAGPDGVVIRTPHETVNVMAVDGARMYSGADGEVTTTSAFYPGDRVGAEGMRTSRGLLATAIGSIFTPVEARVTDVSADGSTADTTVGPILLTAGRLPSEPAERRKQRTAGVVLGTVIRGLEWTHPATGERYLLVRE